MVLEMTGVACVQPPAEMEPASVRWGLTAARDPHSSRRFRCSSQRTAVLEGEAKAGASRWLPRAGRETLNQHLGMAWVGSSNRQVAVRLGTYLPT